jgi:hypothetical protein
MKIKDLLHKGIIAGLCIALSIAVIGLVASYFIESIFFPIAIIAFFLGGFIAARLLPITQKKNIIISGAFIGVITSLLLDVVIIILEIILPSIFTTTGSTPPRAFSLVGPDINMRIQLGLADYLYLGLIFVGYLFLFTAACVVGCYVGSAIQKKSK